jgi:ATP-dependent DNA ligase
MHLEILRVQRSLIISALLPFFETVPLGPGPDPFNHPEWIFEIKYDGFRCLVLLDHGRCKLVSRKRNEFRSFPALNDALATEFKDRSLVLDGEIIFLNSEGKPQFEDLMFRRGSLGSLRSICCGTKARIYDTCC